MNAYPQGFKSGDRVMYKGESFYVLSGPTNTTDGALYKLSKVPPPVSALEHELSPYVDGGSEVSGG